MDFPYSYIDWKSYKKYCCSQKHICLSGPGGTTRRADEICPIRVQYQKDHAADKNKYSRYQS